MVSLSFDACGWKFRFFLGEGEVWESVYICIDGVISCALASGVNESEGGLDFFSGVNGCVYVCVLIGLGNIKL